MRVRLRHDQLQQILARSRISQNHWAIRLGFSRGHWSDLVNGRHPYPSPRTRERLLEVLGVRFEDLFAIEPGPTAWSDVDFRSAIADRYLIDREVGQGGMGAVFLARDIARGRTVAVKVISPEAVSGIGVTAFMREISFLAQLNHPHILPLFDSGVVADHPYYVMPWMRDGSLRDRLRRDVRLALDAALPIVRGVAAALQHAHEQRVLHCDVKPENIVLHGEHAYVMDFGIARATHAEASSWHARSELDLSAGTPAYVSPEQARGDGDLDARADVYSLACVVYEMLAGRPPFEGKDTLAVVSRRFLEPPPPLRRFAPDVPDAVADWVHRAMSIERADRPRTAMEFADGLSRSPSTITIMSRVAFRTSRTLGRVRRGAERPSAMPLAASLRSLRQDVTHAIRALRRSPRFVVSVVLPLALALGAGAAVADLLNRLLLQPPAGVRDPDRIVRFGVRTRQALPPFRVYTRTGLTGLDYEALRSEMRGASHVAGYFVYSPSLGRGPDARPVRVALASASYFPLLGVTPARGRFYQDDEDVAGATSVPCVASDGFWRREMGASSALGQTLLVGQTRCTIVGVAPRGFTGIDLSPVELWVPLRAGAVDIQGNDPQLWTTDRSSWLLLIGRLAPGVTPEAAATEATLAYRSRAPRGRDPELDDQMVLNPLLTARGSQRPQGVRTALWLAASSGLLLLLITANLVNLFVARQLGRLRETAIRLALGGSRARLFRYHAIEVGVLALLAGLAAMIVARWLGPTLRTILIPSVAWESVGILDIRVAVVTTLVALVVGLLIAALVAWHTSRVDAVELLRSGGSPQVAGSRRARVRLGLVGLQAALSMALVLLSAGFVRSFRVAAGTDLGFDVEHLVVASVPLEAAGYDQAQRWAFYERAREELRAVPGVVEASLGYMTPWNNNRNERLTIPGRDSLPPVPNFGEPAFDAVTPDYARAMQLRLLEGRFISEADRAGTAPVVVVSRSLAAHYWPGEASVIGRCIRVGADTMPCREIVGVVADFRFTGALDDDLVPSYFLPLDQARGFRFTPRLFVRVQGDVAAMAATLRRTLQGMDSNLPAARVFPLTDSLEPLLAPWRLGAIAFTALGVLAVIVAVLGLGGVLSFLVSERRREFAVRSALGASRGQIERPVVSQALVVVILGLVAGAVATRVAAPRVQPLLFKVQLMDPLTLGALTLVLLAAAALAALGPARRAGRSDPMEVLRAQ